MTSQFENIGLTPMQCHSIPKLHASTGTEIAFNSTMRSTLNIFFVCALILFFQNCDKNNSPNSSTERKNLDGFSCSLGGLSPRLTFKSFPSQVENFQLSLNGAVVYDTCVENSAGIVRAGTGAISLYFWQEMNLKIGDEIKLFSIACQPGNGPSQVFVDHKLEDQELIAFKDGCGNTLGIGAEVQVPN